MLRHFIKPAHLLAASLRGEKSPHLFALGITLGILAGLVPKDNLTAGALGAVLLALRLNLGAAACSTLVFMWAGALLDPISHRLGHGVLTCSPLEPWLARAFDLPLVPWTNLNNTSVLGNLLLGLMLALPVYLLSRKIMAKFGPAVARRLEAFKFYHVLQVADAVARGRRR